MTYELLDPLETREGKTDAMKQLLASDEFSTLEFGPMKVKYYLALDEVEGAHHRNFKLLELLTGKKQRALQRMSARDYIAACKVMDTLSDTENGDG